MGAGSSRKLYYADVLFKKNLTELRILSVELLAGRAASSGSASLVAPFIVI